jgi:site-specific recombinase XerD
VVVMEWLTLCGAEVSVGGAESQNLASRAITIVCEMRVHETSKFGVADRWRDARRNEKGHNREGCGRSWSQGFRSGAITRPDPRHNSCRKILLSRQCGTVPVPRGWCAVKTIVPVIIPVRTLPLPSRQAQNHGMAAVSIVARSKGGGALSLFVRFSHMGVERYSALGVRLKKREWNASGNAVSKSHRDHKDLNEFVAGRLAHAEAALAAVLASGAVPTSERVRDEYIRRVEGRQLEKEAQEDFLAFADRHVGHYHAKGKYASHKHYGSVVKKLKEYYKRPRLEWEDLSVRFFRDYEAHLFTIGNSRTTVSKNLSMLRTILYAAIREGLFPQEKNPFFHIRLKKDKSKRHRIKKEDIDRLAELQLPTGSMMAIARDMWLFAFFTGGSRVGDVLTLKPPQVSGGRIRFDMRKTGEAHSLPLVPQAAEIAEKYLARGGAYLFPPIETYDTSNKETVFNAVGKATARVNRALRRVADRAEIESALTTHIARHSLAAYCIESGWDVYRIQQVLGHSDIGVTQAYLRGFDRGELDADFEKLFE